MNVLVMWSGGLDSTACLYHLLKTTGYTIYTHHVGLMNHEGRWLAERVAVNEMLEWFRGHCRPFIHTESIIDFRKLDAVPFDGEVAYFVAGQIVLRNRIDKLMTGRCVEDDCPAIRKGDVWTRQYDQRSESTEAGGTPHWTRARGILQAITSKEPEKLIFQSPFMTKTKREAAEYIGPELSSMVWGCRHPKPVEDHFVPCGKCQTCSDFAHNGLTHRPRIGP